MKSTRLRLVGIHGLNGKTWESDKMLRVGRLPDVEIVLDDSSISRRHAEVVYTDKGWSVRDLNSTNGTFINGMRIGRVERTIKQGDHLKFGNLIAVVNQIGEPSGAAASLAEIPHTSVAQVKEQTRTADLSDIMSRLPSPRVPSPDAQTGIWRSSIGTMKDLLTALVQEAASVLEATTTFIALQESAFHQLMIQVGVGGEIEQNEMQGPLSLAEKAFRMRESLLFNPGGELQESPTIDDTPVLSRSTICSVVRASGSNLGILELQRGAGKKAFTSKDLLIADALAAKAGTRIQSMQGSLNQQQQVVLSSVIALAQAVELRDEYTGGHTQRVTDYALVLADELGLPEKERYYLQVGTPLHDLGKIGVADAVLRKPGRLSPLEYELMKGHAAHGAHIVESIPELNPILGIIRNHHERWDGKGYPDGLVGEKIPMLARVVAVVDVFDALTSDRPYRPAMSVEKAFSELQAGAGSQFDANCVAAFFRARPKIELMLLENATSSNTTRPAEIARLREEMQQLPSLLA